VPAHRNLADKLASSSNKSFFLFNFTSPEVYARFGSQGAFFRIKWASRLKGDEVDE
jgi:hypothetical protein